MKNFLRIWLRRSKSDSTNGFLTHRKISTKAGHNFHTSYRWHSVWSRQASRAAVIQNLANDILITHQGHTTVGLLGMQWLMQVLTEIGHPEIAYTVATQTTRPSWGYMISKGATSIWERWDSDTQGSGMNGESQKILSGNLEAWFFQTLAGINYDPEQPGFHHIILRPRPVGDLTFVNASHRSLYGKISSHWKIDGGNFLWDISIPPNTTGTVFVPARDRLSVTEIAEARGTFQWGEVPPLRRWKRSLRNWIRELFFSFLQFRSATMNNR